MGLPKGRTNNPKGRTKGSQNKFTQSAKEAFAIAFDKLGGANSLFKWAKENQTDFYKLYSKLIPVDVTTGEKPISLTDLKNMSDDDLEKLAEMLSAKLTNS